MLILPIGLDKLFLDIPRELPIRLVGVTFSSLAPAAQCCRS
ncbi:hypothetical protein [Psychrobacter sp. WY6]|nr:hypothetical protein [Psychrobacter sp. WY6]